MVMRMKVAHPGRKGFGLWLPLFLVWPVALAMMALLAPVAAAAALIQPVRWRTWILGGPLLMAAVWSLAGLSVYVKDAEDEMAFRIQ